MKKLILISTLCLLLAGQVLAAFSEKYIDLRGTNINAGSTASGTPTYKCVAGNWDGSAVYTPVDGSTPASTVSVGDFASVLTNSVNTNFVYGARVTAVAAGVNGAITLSTTTKAGAVPGLLVAVMEIRVGGAWSGPYKTVKHPFTTTLLYALTNTSSDEVRINIIGGTNYVATNAITHAITGPVRWQGYTNTPGDGGRAVFDGNFTGASFVPLTVTGAGNDFSDIDFQSNGTTGTADGVVFANGFQNRLRVFNMRGHGMTINGNGVANECLSFSNNLSNTAGRGGFYANAASKWTYCISTNNGGSNTEGFYVDTVNANYDHCIAAFNGKDGFGGNVASINMTHCDSYSNVASGLNLTGTTINGAAFIENSNFLRNGAYGINFSGTFNKGGIIMACGFGTGTMVNVSGNFNNTGSVESLYQVNYASGVTPWVSPDTGDFRINLQAAMNTGRGVFPFSPTIGYPDIGAAMHTNTACPVVTGVNSSFFSFE